MTRGLHEVTVDDPPMMIRPSAPPASVGIACGERPLAVVRQAESRMEWHADTGIEPRDEEMNWILNFHLVKCCENVW